MTYTEEVARTKWCPQARQPTFSLNEDGTHAPSPKSPVINRVSKHDGSTALPSACLCVASDCMLWEPMDMLIDNKRVVEGYCGLKK